MKVILIMAMIIVAMIMIVATCFATTRRAFIPMQLEKPCAVGKSYLTNLQARAVKRLDTLSLIDIAAPHIARTGTHPARPAN